MFTINGNPLLVSELEVLEELRRQIILNGLNLFNEFKVTGHNIMTNCPFHKGGQERKPSFGISTRDMTCHCFTCGWVGNLELMISNVFGYDDDGAFGRKWLLKNFVSVSIEHRKPLGIDFARGEKHKPSRVKTFTEEELDSYRYTHPYMYERGLTDEIIEKFDIGYDNSTECLTFPVYHIDRSPAFIARRSVRLKYFNYPTGVSKPVYAGERFVSGMYKQAVISEGILDALTCWVYGIPGMALIGTGTEEQYEILRRLPVRKYIIATDPDPAGQLAAEKLRNKLSPYKLITQFDIPPNTDLNKLGPKILELNEIY